MTKKANMIVVASHAPSTSLKYFAFSRDDGSLTKTSAYNSWQTLELGSGGSYWNDKYPRCNGGTAWVREHVLNKLGREVDRMNKGLANEKCVFMPLELFV